MTLHCGLWSTDAKGERTFLFTGVMPVRDIEGPPVTLEAIEKLCDDIDKNAQRHMMSFRLDMQRAMLLAEPAVLQVLATRIIGRRF